MLVSRHHEGAVCIDDVHREICRVHTGGQVGGRERERQAAVAVRSAIGSAQSGGGEVDRGDICVTLAARDSAGPVSGEHTDLRNRSCLDAYGAGGQAGCVARDAEGIAGVQSCGEGRRCLRKQRARTTCPVDLVGVRLDQAALGRSGSWSGGRLQRDGVGRRCSCRAVRIQAGDGEGSTIIGAHGVGADEVLAVDRRSCRV